MKLSLRAGALRAASERARTEYRLDLASIPEADQNAMRDKAQGLSSKYPSIDATEILELQKTTYALFGGDIEKALTLIEPLIKSFIADVTAVGVQKAGENLSSFLKAMDNLNVNEGPDGGVSNIEAILEGWIRAKQIEGKEIVSFTEEEPEVVDIMTALKESIEKAKSGKKPMKRSKGKAKKGESETKTSKKAG